MLHPSSLIFLPLVVLVSSVLDISEANSKMVARLRSPKAKEVMIKLQEDCDDMKDSYDDYTIKLESNNDLIEPINVYRKVYALAKGTDCAKDKPPSEDAMKQYTNRCKKSLLSDELGEFSFKIFLSKRKVVEIDYNLYVKCTSDPSSCDDTKKQATEELNGLLLTPERKSAVLETLEKRLDECFKRETAQLLKKLVQDTETTNACLEAKS